MSPPRPATHRVARASGVIRMLPATLALIASGSAKKGDVIGVARIAAIQGAKRTSELVPLCHPLPITRVAVDFELDAAASLLRCTAQVETLGRTGVEMEALTAVQVGLLTVYDMCKAVDRGMVMGDIRAAAQERRQVGRLGRGGVGLAATSLPARRPASAHFRNSRQPGTRCRRLRIGRAAVPAVRGSSQTSKNSSASGLRNSRSRCARCRALSSSPARASALAQAIVKRVSIR